METDPAVLIECIEDSTDRPLLDMADKEKEIKELLDSRQEKYLAADDLIIETSYLTINAVVEQIQRKIEDQQDAARRTNN